MLLHWNFLFPELPVSLSSHEKCQNVRKTSTSLDGLAWKGQYWVLADRCRISRKGGTSRSRRDHQPYILPKFPKISMKLKTVHWSTWRYILCAKILSGGNNIVCTYSCIHCRFLPVVLLPLFSAFASDAFSSVGPDPPRPVRSGRTLRRCMCRQRACVVFSHDESHLCGSK